MAISTSPEVKALAAKESRYDVAVVSEDDTGRALPGLQIRVYPTGAKAWQYRYTHPRDKSPRRRTYGPYPAIALKAARAKHRDDVLLVERGIDPSEHEAAQQAAADKAAAVCTVAQLAEDFGTEVLSQRKDPGQASRIINKEILPKLGKRHVRDVKRRDGVLLARAVKNRGAPVMANRVAVTLVQLFRFAADEGHIEVNPFDRLRRPTKEKARDRKLSVDELRTLWHELDARASSQPGGSLKKGRDDNRGTRDEPRISRPLALALKLLLVTGQRRGELAKARWRDVDLDAHTWRIPPEHSKNELEHVVPLSPLAVEILTELQLLAGTSAYVLPSTQSRRRADRPVTDKSITRAAARNQSGLDHWTAHDLRRSAASHLNRIGVDAIVVERILNHKLPGMLNVYNRHDYQPEMRDALNRWSDELRRIVAGESNVVAIETTPRRRSLEAAARRVLEGHAPTAEEIEHARQVLRDLET